MKQLSIINYQLSMVITLLILPVVLYAGGKGTTGAQFLKIGVGARATGMAETFAGLADDATAIYWNPAGLTQIQTKELTLTHTEWFEGIKYENIGYAQPIGKQGSLGTSYSLIHMDEMTVTKEDPYGLYTGEGGTFTAKDQALILSYSHKATEAISLGTNLKLIHQENAGRTANGYALDLATFYKTPLEGLSLGLNLQNIGPGIKFIRQEDPLPFNIKAGGAYRMFNDNLALALDLNLPSENDSSLHFGTEYWIKNILALRAGYNTRSQGNELGRFNLGEGLSAGLGVKAKDFQFDAAYVPYGDLGDTYRVSLLTRFGAQRTEDRGEKVGGREGIEKKIEPEVVKRVEKIKEAEKIKKIKQVKEIRELTEIKKRAKPEVVKKEREMPKRLRKNDLLIIATIFKQTKDHLLLHVRLINISDHYIYVSPFHLGLITETIGSTPYIYSPKTYRCDHFLIGRGLKPLQEMCGFLLFETTEPPKGLIFDDKIGNFSSTDLP